MKPWDIQHDDAGKPVLLHTADQLRAAQVAILREAALRMPGDYSHDAVCRMADELENGAHSPSPPSAPVGAAPLPEDVREMVSDLHLYAKTGNSPIAKAICLQAANMLERLAEQAAKWQALAESQARLAEVAARRRARDARLTEGE